MLRSILKRGGPAIAVAVAVFLAGCDDNGAVTPLDHDTGIAPELSIGFEAAEHATSPGRVAVAIRATTGSGEALAGMQGYFKFDSRRLRYIGQEAGDNLVLVNDSEADRGSLRLMSLDITGLDARAAVLVFEALGAEYDRGISFELEAAETVSGEHMFKASVARSVDFVLDMVVPEQASRLSIDDWARHLAPDMVAADGSVMEPLQTPGALVTGLVYGNVNLDAGQLINVLDVFALSNMSVGNFEIIIGTDSPNLDGVIAGNLVPFNTSNDLLPGVESDGVSRQINVLDVTVVARCSVGIPQPLCSPAEVIPGRVDPFAVKPIATISASDANNITSDRTLYADTLYQVSGFVTVRNGATLTIEPGTEIQGSDQFSALVIKRDGRIVADGTLLEPIKFTCSVAEPNKTKGCWGGLALAGNAPVVEGQTQTGATDDGVVAGRSAAGCNERLLEGTADVEFGGCNPDDDSGVLRYVIEEFSGLEISPNNELNGITLGGVGAGTTIDFVQVHAGLDDCWEHFGGTVSSKHLYLTACSDDYFDISYGFNGDVQFVIIQSDPSDSDHGIEADNTENSATYGQGFQKGTDPLNSVTRPDLWNFTFVGDQDDALRLRRGNRLMLNNAIFHNYTQGVRIDNIETCGGGVNDEPTLSVEVENSIFSEIATLNSGNPGAPCFDPFIVSGTNGNLVLPAATACMKDPMHKLLPDFRPIFGSACATTVGGTPPDNGFFDTSATFIGATRPSTASGGNIPWYSGWTRGWQTATTP